MSDPYSGPFSTWAIVAWDERGYGVLLDADEHTKEDARDWGCDCHWDGQVPARGLWRWEGSLRFDAVDGEVCDVIGKWSPIWRMSSDLTSGGDGG